jgi:hypothetical protein
MQLVVKSGWACGEFECHTNPKNWLMRRFFPSRRRFHPSSLLSDAQISHNIVFRLEMWPHFCLRDPADAREQTNQVKIVFSSVSAMKVSTPSSGRHPLPDAWQWISLPQERALMQPAIVEQTRDDSDTELFSHLSQRDASENKDKLVL